MGADNTLRSYGDVSRKDSVLPLVEILTATETWFLQNLGKTKATDMVHISLTDTLFTAASLATEEAADYSYNALSTPSRLTNVVEQIVDPIRVSKAQQWIQKYTMEDELTRQTTKALKDWGNAAEFDILRSTLVTGVSGTAPKMKGILQAISKSNTYTVQTSGVAFSASILKGLLKNCWENNNGEVPTDLFLGSYLKSVFDTFTAGQTKFVMAKEAAISDYTDVYDSGGFGRLIVHLHRYLNQSGDSYGGRVLALKPEKLKIAYLKEPYIDEPKASGPYDQKAVVGALTLEVRNQDIATFSEGYFIG